MIDFMESLTEGQRFKMEAYWEAFNTDGLNIPSMRPKYMVDHFRSFVGKEHKKVVQAAPFVFFPFMEKPQRELWFSLCYLATYVFQTKIINLDKYVEDLKKHIDILLYHVLKMNAQWVNKPKFHMLTHLPQAVKRFGPPCLFASEKFEAYNGILRTASIHSNRHSPGRDIAIHFSNYQAMRLTLSGAFLFDHQSKTHFQPSPRVTEAFANDKHLQKMMGWNTTDTPNDPELKRPKIQEENKKPLPSHLSEEYPHTQFCQIQSIKTHKYDTIQKGTRVLVSKYLMIIQIRTNFNFSSQNK